MLPPVRLDDELMTVMLANMRNPDERRGDLKHRCLVEAAAADLQPHRQVLGAESAWDGNAWHAVHVEHDVVVAPATTSATGGR